MHTLYTYINIEMYQLSCQMKLNKWCRNYYHYYYHYYCKSDCVISFL